MVTVFVYVSCDCVIGVYATKELCKIEGSKASMDRFGVSGYVDGPYQVVAE